MIALGWLSEVWIAWAAILAIGFAVFETIAMRSKRQDYDTLSRNIQWLVDREPWIKWATLFLWGAFATWFAAHIWGSLL